MTEMMDTPDATDVTGWQALTHNLNNAAILTPADPAVAPSYPSITVAGARASLYVDPAGVLCLSLHLDPNELPDWLNPVDGGVPLRITINDGTVFADTTNAQGVTGDTIDTAGA